MKKWKIFRWNSHFSWQFEPHSKGFQSWQHFSPQLDQITSKISMFESAVFTALDYRLAFYGLPLEHREHPSYFIKLYSSRLIIMFRFQLHCTGEIEIWRISKRCTQTTYMNMISFIRLKTGSFRWWLLILVRVILRGLGIQRNKVMPVSCVILQMSSIPGPKPFQAFCQLHTRLISRGNFKKVMTPTSCHFIAH